MLFKCLQAPNIPNISYKPSGDSSYDVLVKNIRNVQQTIELAAEIKPPPPKKPCLSSGKLMKNGQSGVNKKNAVGDIDVSNNYFRLKNYKTMFIVAGVSHNECVKSYSFSDFIRVNINYERNWC